MAIEYGDYACIERGLKWIGNIHDEKPGKPKTTRRLRKRIARDSATSAGVR